MIIFSRWNTIATRKLSMFVTDSFAKMKPRIFKNPEIQHRFDTDGYVVIDFISADEAKLIEAKFYELHSSLPKGFYSAAFTPDENFKQEIFEHTNKVLQKAIDDNFEHYKTLGSTFLCKAPGPEGKVNVHQDWTCVDESKFYSATIWVPMLDTTEENGALRVLPGSHLFFNYYRSNNIPVFYRNNQPLLWESMITEPMKAGQAFVLNHAVIHGSSPNLTSKERLVVAFAVAPKDAPLVFYHKEVNDPSTKVEKFDMPDDFFQRYYNAGERPLFGTLVETLDHPVPETSRKELLQLINTERTKRNLPPVVDAEAGTTTVAPEKEPWVDERSFFEKYSPNNIIAELRKRILQQP